MVSLTCKEAEAAYQAALRLCQELGVETLALEPLAGLARLALASGDLRHCSDAGQRAGNCPGG